MTSISGGEAILTFTTRAVHPKGKRHDVRDRADTGLSLVLAASVVPLLVIAVLAVATLLT